MLHFATKMDSLDWAKRLFEAGADPTAKDAKGRTPQDVVPSNEGEVYTYLKKGSLTWWLWQKQYWRYSQCIRELCGI